MTNYLVSIGTSSDDVLRLLATLETLGLLDVRTVMDEETGDVE
jgi:hypothetical protein